MSVDTGTIEQLVHDRLEALTKGNVPVYDGVVPATPPTIAPKGTPPDLRVRPYIAWWGGDEGREGAAEALDPRDRDDVAWTGRLTIVAGVASHLRAVVHAVTSGLHLTEVDLPGASTSLLRVANVSEQRVDRSETPSRLYRLLELDLRAGT